MLSIKEGRFSDCTFLEDIVGKKILIKQYRNQPTSIQGEIVRFSNGSRGVDIIINNWEDGLAGYFLHNIEDASIV